MPKDQINISPYPTFIPYGKQKLNSSDINAVVKTLKQPYITQGPTVTAFENAICRYTGAEFACAISSGTAGLHVACRALGLTEEDWLWTTPISFIASANCALYCNAQVDFVDIDPETRNLSSYALEEKLRIASKMKRLPKVLVVVHFAGLSADMQRIKDLSEEYSFSIIEDACHALGGNYCQEKIGRSIWCDFSVFSFHPVKAITTGEGGVLCTNNEDLYHKAKLLTQQGITRDPNEMELEYEGPWYYEQSTLGYNYRMTDFQASLGLSQLKHLDEYIETRNKLASHYYNHLEKLPLTLPLANTLDADLNAFHLYVIELTEYAPITRSELYAGLTRLNIGVNVHYIPIHLQPFYRKLGFKEGDFPNAEQYYAHCLTIPLFVQLSRKEQDFIIYCLSEFLTK